MNEKYELLLDESIEVAGIRLYRIRAKVAFGGVAEGEKGGYIQKEENLSVVGDAWVVGNARVGGDARVGDNARVEGDAWVVGHSIQD